MPGQPCVTLAWLLEGRHHGRSAARGHRCYPPWPMGGQGSERGCLALWVGVHQGRGKEFWLGTRVQGLVGAPGVSEVLSGVRVVS